MNQPIPPTYENVRTALSYLSADIDGGDWWKILAAVADGLGEDGRDLAEDWSRTAPDRYKAASFRDSWKSACKPGKTTIATLWGAAKKEGWKPNYGDPDPDGTKDLERRKAQAKTEADKQAIEEQHQAEEDAHDLWNTGKPVSPDHPYYARKLPGTIPPDTLRETTVDYAVEKVGIKHPRGKDGLLAGRVLVVPVTLNGRWTTAELIDEQGRKGALRGQGTKPPGCHWAAQPLPEGDGAGSTIAIGEGVSTVLSVRHATGHHVLAALSCGNLPNVAQTMRAQLPAARLLILGDLGNGQKDAERAARETGAALAVPMFTPEQVEAFQHQHGKPPTDFNDLHALAGLDEVWRQIDAALETSAQAKAPASPSDAKERKQKERKEKVERMKEWTKDMPLAYVSDNGRPGLVKQSKAAKILANDLDDLAYDPVQQTWLRFQTGLWNRVSDTHALATIMDAIDRNGGDDVGYDSAYPNGIAVFLKARLCADGFDQNPDLIPFKNGVLNIRSGVISDHAQTYRLTWQLPYLYVPGAACVPVIEWLKECVGGDLDQVEVLRAYIKAVLLGRSDLQRYLEIQGPPGSGKGTFLRLVAAVVGERNMHTTTMKQLENNRFEVANLYGKRLVQITDAEKYTGDTAILKAITGEDYLPYEAKHKQGGESFKFGGLVLIAANNPTTTGDYAGALHRRRISIRFDHVVDATKRRDLEAEFTPYLSGVINWVLGLPDTRMVELLRDTDRQSARLAENSLRAMLDVNPVAAWANERLILAPGIQTGVGVKRLENATESDGMGQRTSHTRVIDSGKYLYANYSQWCMDHGQKELGQKNFSGALESALCSQGKLPGIKRLPNSGGKGSRFEGIRLRGDADEGVPCLFCLNSTGKVRVENESSTARSPESTISTVNVDSSSHEEENWELADPAQQFIPGADDEKILELKSGDFCRTSRTSRTPKGFQPYPPTHTSRTSRTDPYSDGNGTAPVHGNSKSCWDCQHWTDQCVKGHVAETDPDTPKLCFRAREAAA